MSIASIAYFNISTTGTSAPAASRAVTAAQRLPAAEAPQHADRGPAGRPHVLFKAIVSALKEIGLGSAPAPTDNAVPVATTAAAASAEPGSSATPASGDSAAPEGGAATGRIHDAVLAFANALAQALRGESGAAPAEGSGQGDGAAVEHGERHHHPFLRHEIRQERREERRQERREDRRAGDDGVRAYAGLADRLEALAAAVKPDAGTGTAPAPAASASPAAPSSEPVVAPAPAAPAAAAAADPVAASSSAGGSAAATSGDATPPAASTPVAHPLFDAFKELLSALKANAGSATPVKDAATELAAFLHALSQALQPSGAAPARMHAGMLIDMTA
jgi:hypothetical protein